MAERKPKDKRKDEEDTTEFDNCQELREEVPSVPKEGLGKQRAEYERKRGQKKRAG